MKKFNILTKLLFLFAVLGVFITSCDPDPIIDNPSVDFVSGTGFISDDAAVTGGETFKVKISASMGSAEMNTFAVQKDGVNLPSALYTIDGVEDNNPKLLFDADRTSFTYEIVVTSHDTGAATYSFIVSSDDAGKTSASIEITADAVKVDPTLANNMNSSIELDNPGTVQIVLTGIKGSSALKSIEVLEEGALITDLTRLSWESTQFSANPNLLTGTDVDGFANKKLFLKSSNVVGAQNYTITLEDEAGGKSTIAYTITLKPLATPITSEFPDVRMYNDAGTNFGAIDLETGTNVSSSNASKDLIDSGNDGNGLWQQSISPDAATSLRSLDAAIKYGDITSRELLVSAYDSGTEIASSSSLVVGSTLACRKADVYYLITVTAINPTTNDNNDYYTFSIKKSE